MLVAGKPLSRGAPIYTTSGYFGHSVGACLFHAVVSLERRGTTRRLASTTSEAS